MAQAELALLCFLLLQDEEPHNAQPAHRDWELPAVRTLQIYARDQTGQRKSMRRVIFSLKEVKHIFRLTTKQNISDSQRVLEMEFSGDAILYLLDTYVYVLPRARVVTLQHWALPRGTSWSTNFDMKNLIPCRCAKVCSRLLETSTQELLFVALCLVLCIISS